MKRIAWIFVFVFVVFSQCKKETIVEDEKPEKENHHPFLIVTKDQFSELRSKSDQEPWKSMKSDAIERSRKGSASKPYDLQYYVGAAALAYILDEDNAQVHANRVRDAIINQYSKLDFEEGNSWGGVVPPMGSAFVAILALDIVYDALSIDDIMACEEVISGQIFKISRKGSWVTVRLGTHGTWDIYKGDRSTPDDDYYDKTMFQITEDGVSPVTNHYAWERVGGGNSRVSKSGYMDVLEFTGIDKRYYNNERLQKFQRWLFGSSVNCAKEMAIFGDMLPTQGISNDMLHRRVVNFDMEAAGYAAWFHDGRPAYGNIISYIIPNQELPTPVVPQSKLYTNGGAFFRENADDPKGLHAVLYNIMSQDEWHTHQEVNGLALSGYGNRLLVNGGRLGEPTRAASLNNTLTINGDDHVRRVGGGLAEGFTADLLDYACGFSGDAMSNASHYRNLILVHGESNINPYFVIFDEVDASTGDLIKNYLHPANESSISTVLDKAEYEARIDHEYTVPGTRISVFYGTPPDEVNIEKVPSAVPDRYPGYPDHNRLESVYSTDAEGDLNLVTLLIPYDGSHSKPSISRIEAADYSGCSIDHGSGIQDILLESGGGQELMHDPTVFNGIMLAARNEDSANQFYFVKQGTKFEHGITGFESDGPISIYSRGNYGVILSQGVTVTLKNQGIENVVFTPTVTVVDSGTNFIQVQLPSGEVKFSGN